MPCSWLPWGLPYIAKLRPQVLQVHGNGAETQRLCRGWTHSWSIEVMLPGNSNGGNGICLTTCEESHKSKNIRRISNKDGSAWFRGRIQGSNGRYQGDTKCNPSWSRASNTWEIHELLDLETNWPSLYWSRYTSESSYFRTECDGVQKRRQLPCLRERGRFRSFHIAEEVERHIWDECELPQVCIHLNLPFGVRRRNLPQRWCRARHLCKARRWNPWSGSYFIRKVVLQTHLHAEVHHLSGILRS